MQTPITLEALAAVVGILGFVAGVWWVVDAKITATAAALAAHKLHVAETYMSKASGGAAIERNTEAVESMASALKTEIVRVETAVVGRIERMENRVFNGTGPPHKS